MKIREEYDEARAREVSGLADGTRSTYIEWLSEQQVVLLRQMLWMLNALRREAAGDAGPEDEDGADPV